MLTICRMSNADDIGDQFHRKKPGAFIRGIGLTSVLFVAFVFAWAFALYDNSPVEKVIAAVLLILFVLSFAMIYIRQKQADRYFMAYIMSDELSSPVIAADLTRACTNDVLFGANFSLSFSNERSNWGKIERNMRKMHYAAAVDEFLSREDVLTYCGSVIEEVISISETGKEYRIKAKLRRLDTKHFFITRYTRTLRIPADFINSDKLADRLRAIS
ncbi:MAG: hypothetical protein IJ874_05950 [Ruminococcus sp.]|nr:hypothetical protein [Ruminococcus sp.]